MTLQAVFDDSGSKGQGRFMSMAGLMGSSELLARLADEWRKHLDAKHPGRIGYFKMDEAVHLDGEFRHWQQRNRDDKVVQMSKVIDRNDLFQITAVVDLRAFEKVFGVWEDVPGGHAMRHPFMLLAECVLSSCVTEAVKRGHTKPIEIIYDEQKRYRPMFQEAYKEYLAVEAEFPERAAVMPYQPWFRDDLDFVMLQAADMLAGEARLLPVDDKPAPLKKDLCPQLKASGMHWMLDEIRLLNMDRHVRDYVANNRG